MASDELEQVERQGLVHPITGEVIDLEDATTDQLAAAIDLAKAGKGALDDFNRTVGEELLARMDRRGKWTVRLGGYEISAPRPNLEETEWSNPEGLRADLLALAEEGVIDREAVEEAVTVEEVYKVRAVGIRALDAIATGNERVGEVLAAHRRSKPKDRRVAVKTTR